MKPDDLDVPAFRERLQSYLDGEMAPEAARRFLAFLETHPAALKDAEEARHVWALLSTYADEPVPEGFAERVFERVGVEPSMRLRTGGRVRAIAAAAAVLVTVGGVALWRQSMAPEPASAASAALEAVPVELLESEHLASLASLSDEEFEALLSADPETLATEAAKNQGG